MRGIVVIAILFFWISSINSTETLGLTRCINSTQTFDFQKNSYYEASVQLITNDEAGLYVGSWFSPQISITLLNPDESRTEVFDYFVYGPRGNELYHHQQIIRLEPRKTQTFALENDETKAQAGWDIDEIGTYLIEIIPNQNLQNNTRVFVKYLSDCTPSTMPMTINGIRGVYGFRAIFDAQPSYQKDFVEWQKQTKIQDDIQSEFMKNLTQTQTNLAEKSVGLTWVSLLLAAGALFLAAIQTVTKNQFFQLASLEHYFMDITIICFLLALLMGILILIVEIKIEREQFVFISLIGGVVYYWILKPHLSKPSSSNSSKQ